MSRFGLPIGGRISLSVRDPTLAVIVPRCDFVKELSGSVVILVAYQFELPNERQNDPRKGQNGSRMRFHLA